MAKVTLNATASDILNRINANALKAINARKLKEARDPDHELDELELLNKQCTEMLNELDKQCNDEIKNVTDVNVRKITKARYNLMKVEGKAEFEKLMEPLRLTPEMAGNITEVVADNAGAKVGKFFSAPVKAIVGFTNGVVEYSGASKFFSFRK